MAVLLQSISLVCGAWYTRDQTMTFVPARHIDTKTPINSSKPSQTSERKPRTGILESLEIPKWILPLIDIFAFLGRVNTAEK